MDRLGTREGRKYPVLEPPTAREEQAMRANPRLEGNHAVLLVGYNSRNHWFL